MHEDFYERNLTDCAGCVEILVWRSSDFWVYLRSIVRQAETEFYTDKTGTDTRKRY